MLSFIHSRRVAHDLMVLAVLAMEVFFAWRASLMYVFILTGRVSAYELDVVRWLVFLAVGVFGFALATHRHAGVEAIRKRKMSGNGWALMGIFLAAGVVILHDVAATIYTVGAVDTFGAWVAVVGMCFLVFLPFLVGYMSHAIAAGIEEERALWAQRKIARWKQTAELRAAKQYYLGGGYQPLAPEARISPPAQQIPMASESSEQMVKTGEWRIVTPGEIPVVTKEAGANGHLSFRDGASVALVESIPGGWGSTPGI